MPGWFLRRAMLAVLWCTVSASGALPPEAWVPIRWTGGPLELAWRARTKTSPADAAVRDAISRWYDPDTLRLLDNSPANCLLVTWSAPVDAAVQVEQQRLVKVYAEAAHQRGLVVLGLVYAPGEPSKIAADAARAGLDGLVLEGEFTEEFAVALRKAASSMAIVEIARDATPWRWRSAAIIAVEGIAPSGRNLSEMGIRGSPSSEPWIESNLWLGRSFGLYSPSPPVWISSRLHNASPVDYERAVADAAAAGAHWIVSFEDDFRAKLRAGDPSVVEAWHRLWGYLKFAESHTGSRVLEPYGNVGVVIDPASTNQDEYLKLIARRQVQYRLIKRSDLETAKLAKLRAVVAIELDPPSTAEHKLLQDYAENGGVVIAPPSWGGTPTAGPLAEVPAGKGRVIVYKDPDPESVARDLKEMLSDDELGLVPFNVPSVITLAAGGAPGQPLVVQLLNYFDRPVEAITLRVAGMFGSARLETPEGVVEDLPLRTEEGKTEVTIPKLLLWGTVSMH